MKTRKLNKKLVLNKKTISNLNRNELLEMKAGAVPATDLCTNPIWMPTCTGICASDWTCPNVTCPEHTIFDASCPVMCPTSAC